MWSTVNNSAQRSPAPEAIGFNAHLVFFDRDHDQHISLEETGLGLERIGFGHLIAWPAAALIHLGVAGLGLVRGNLQNPLQLSIPSVGLLRHPDTAVLDDHADFDSSRLDAIFMKYGRQYAGRALTLPELIRMTSDRLRAQTHGLKELMLLPGGAAGTAIEWGALFWLAGEMRDGQRLLSKRDVLRFYTDPEFFQEVAKRVERARARRSRSAAGGLRNLVQRWVL